MSATVHSVGYSSTPGADVAHIQFGGDTPEVSTEERKSTGLPTTIKPLQLSRKEIGQLRRKHLTRELRKLPCGHGAIVGVEPRHNCDACWLTHFRTLPNVKWIDDQGKPYDDLAQELYDQVVAVRGTKYAKRLLWFVKTNAQLHTAGKGGAI